MRYTRCGPFWLAPVSAAFLNDLEDFLEKLPSARPYQRYGRFYAGCAPGISAAFLNGVEDFLEQFSYRPYGPFTDGTGNHYTLSEWINHVEDFLTAYSCQEALDPASAVLSRAYRAPDQHIDLRPVPSDQTRWSAYGFAGTRERENAPDELILVDYESCEAVCKGVKTR